MVCKYIQRLLTIDARIELFHGLRSFLSNHTALRQLKTLS